MATLTLGGQQIEIGSGRVTYIEPSLTVALEETYLKEDLLQIEFDGDLLLDVGWYRHSGRRGIFRVVIIANVDWSHPVFQSEAIDPAEMVEVIEEAIKVIGRNTSLNKL